MPRPKSKRGRGFTHSKTGRYHDQRGGGERVNRGERRYPAVGSEDRSRSSSRDRECDVRKGATNDSVSTADSVTSASSFFEAQSDGGSTLVSFSEVNESVEVVEAQHTSNAVNAECIVPDENQASARQEAFDLFQLVSPNFWRVIKGKEGFHLVCVSKGTENIAIQREVFALFTGEVKVFVHRKLMSEEFHKALLDQSQPISLTAATVKSFLDRMSKVVLLIRSNFEICAGSDKVELEPLWKSDESGFIDKNPYDESRYIETFRSNSCSVLVPVRNWNCEDCKRAAGRLRYRFKHHQDEQFETTTRNICLDETQMRAKLKEQRRELKIARRKISYLENKVRNLIEAEGVNLDKDTSEICNEILRESQLTPIQQLFIQQQYKMPTLKGATGMRWHPTMIRFALLIKSTSSAAYSAISSSGVIRLPADRTLFDYEHAIPRSEGIFTDKLKSLGESVKNFEKEHQHYYTLLTDEVHVSQKLVYRKSDGSLVGYVKLSEVEAEMESLIASIKEGKGAEVKPTVASKILTYMVKGCTNSVKEVVVAYPVGCLSKEQRFDRTWSVISVCEEVGVKILAMVCDGSSVIRSFIKMHTPASPSASSIVFDTVNLCAPDRILYFISDQPHLIKTIINCFAKSGMSSKHTGIFFKNGEYIVWKTIEKLYKEEVNQTLRRSYKLNAQIVYLTSYSCMKVSLAAQVLSKTVGSDLKDRNWPGTKATAEFILKGNDFFDNLNGAHTNQAIRTANPRLATYRCVDDERFEELLDFELYLLGWEEEVKYLNGVAEAQKTKMTLSYQTLEGIYMTNNAFCGAVKFLLNIGAHFVNGRVFCQDPLEQYFGKQRASGGGRVNPTVSSFISTDTKISIHMDLNVRKRSGDCEAFSSAMQISDEPVRKRRKSV